MIPEKVVICKHLPVSHEPENTNDVAVRTPKAIIGFLESLDN